MQWTWGAIFDVIATGSAHISLLGGNDTHDSRSVFNDHHHHHHQNDSPRGARCRGSGGPCVPPPPARCPRAGWPVNITTTITISITTTIIVIVVLYLFLLFVYFTCDLVDCILLNCNSICVSRVLVQGHPDLPASLGGGNADPPPGRPSTPHQAYIDRKSDPSRV